MKTIFLAVLVLGFLTIAAPTQSLANNADSTSPSCRASFWQDVRLLVENCTEKSDKNSQNIPLKLRTDCHDIKIVNGLIYFNLYSEKFIASVSISDFSDGDDLYDVLAQSTRGNCVAELKNVPAYGDPLAALAGGRR